MDNNLVKHAHMASSSWSSTSTNVYWVFTKLGSKVIRVIPSIKYIKKSHFTDWNSSIHLSPLHCVCDHWYFIVHPTFAIKCWGQRSWVWHACLAYLVLILLLYMLLVCGPMAVFSISGLVYLLRICQLHCFLTTCKQKQKSIKNCIISTWEEWTLLLYVWV